MAKSVDDRGRGARLARRDEGAYYWYVTEEQRSQPGLKILHIPIDEVLCRAVLIYARKSCSCTNNNFCH